MKFLRQICAATILIVALSLSAFADGDTIHTGYVAPPSSTGSASMTSDDGAGSFDPVTLALESITQSMLSLF